MISKSDMLKNYVKILDIFKQYVKNIRKTMLEILLKLFLKAILLKIMTENV